MSSANLTEHAFNLTLQLGVMARESDAARQAVEHIDALIFEGVWQRQRV